jgi:hypothetical protein
MEILQVVIDGIVRSRLKEVQEWFFVSPELDKKDDPTR